MFSSKRDCFEWTIQQLLRGTRRLFPSSYMYIENTFQAIRSTFISLELNLFGLACVAGAERRGGGERKSRKRGKGKGAPYQLSSIPLPFFHSSLSPTFSEACYAGQFGHSRATDVFSKLQGLQYYFPDNFRCNLKFYESKNFSRD